MECLCWVEMKRCPVLQHVVIIFYERRVTPRSLLPVSIPPQGVAWCWIGTKHLCFSHFISLLTETLNPENQLKHTKGFILRIPTVKTQGVSTVPRVRNWTLWTCWTNSAGKNNTHPALGRFKYIPNANSKLSVILPASLNSHHGSAVEQEI